MQKSILIFIFCVLLNQVTPKTTVKKEELTNKKVALAKQLGPQSPKWGELAAITKESKNNKNKTKSLINLLKVVTAKEIDVPDTTVIGNITIRNATQHTYGTDTAQNQNTTYGNIFNKTTTQATTKADKETLYTLLTNAIDYKTNFTLSKTKKKYLANETLGAKLASLKLNTTTEKPKPPEILAPTMIPIFKPMQNNQRSITQPLSNELIRQEVNEDINSNVNQIQKIVQNGFNQIPIDNKIGPEVNLKPIPQDVIRNDNVTLFLEYVDNSLGNGITPNTNNLMEKDTIIPQVISNALISNNLNNGPNGLSPIGISTGQNIFQPNNMQWSHNEHKQYVNAFQPNHINPSQNIFNPGNVPNPIVANPDTVTQNGFVFNGPNQELTGLNPNTARPNLNAVNPSNTNIGQNAFVAEPSKVPQYGHPQNNLNIEQSAFNPSLNQNGFNPSNSNIILNNINLAPNALRSQTNSNAGPSALNQIHNKNTIHDELNYNYPNTKEMGTNQNNDIMRSVRSGLDFSFTSNQQNIPQSVNFNEPQIGQMLDALRNVFSENNLNSVPNDYSRNLNLIPENNAPTAIFPQENARAIQNPTIFPNDYGRNGLNMNSENNAPTVLYPQENVRTIQNPWTIPNEWINKRNGLNTDSESNAPTVIFPQENGRAIHNTGIPNEYRHMSPENNAPNVILPKENARIISSPESYIHRSDYHSNSNPKYTTGFELPCFRASDILDDFYQPQTQQPRPILNPITENPMISLDNPIIIEHERDSDEAVAIVFKPKNISLLKFYGDLLKKITLTVLVPYHISKLAA